MPRAQENNITSPPEAAGPVESILSPEASLSKGGFNPNRSGSPKGRSPGFGPASAAQLLAVLYKKSLRNKSHVAEQAFHRSRRYGTLVEPLDPPSATPSGPLLACCSENSAHTHPPRGTKTESIP